MIWAPDESTPDLIVHHLILSQNGDPIRDGIDWGKLETKSDIVRHRAIWNWKKHLEKFSLTYSSNRSPGDRSRDESSTITPVMKTITPVKAFWLSMSV